MVVGDLKPAGKRQWDHERRFLADAGEGSESFQDQVGQDIGPTDFGRLGEFVGAGEVRLEEIA